MGVGCFVKNLSILAIIAIAFSTTSSHAEILTHRYKSSCTSYASKKIYCHGGQTASDTYLNDTFSLDLSSLSQGGSNTTAANIMTRWQPVKNFDYIVEKRKFLGFVATDDTMLFFGGMNINTKLYNISTAFHMDTESWETLPSYRDYAGEEKQISHSSVTYSPSPNNKVYFFGGMTQFPVGHTYQSLNSMLTTTTRALTSGQIPTDGLGFAQSVLYDVNTKSWSTTSPQAQPPTDSLRQLSFLDTNTNTIYYFGGNYATVADDYKTSILGSFSEATTFNIITGSWGKASFGGTVPEYRVAPSLTVLPSNNVLMYGGGPEDRSVNKKLLSDFCYTLDLTSLNWTLHNLDLPYGSTSLVFRDSHSAVLVQTPESVSIFILFGLQLNTPLNDMLILDVKYMDKLRFVTTFPYADQKDLPLNATGNTKSETENEAKLSQGAIIGIAVSCAAVIIAAITGYILYYRRKKSNENTRENLVAEEESNPSHQMNELYVDWDNIEKQYDQNDKNYYYENYNNNVSSSLNTSPELYQNNYSPDLPPPDAVKSFAPHTRTASDVNLPVQNSVTTFLSSEQSNSPATTSTVVSATGANSNLSTRSPQQNIILLEKPDVGNEDK